MAERKNTNTQPVLDNSALAADPDLEKSKTVYALAKTQYRSIIHQVQSADKNTVSTFVTATKAKLAELGVPRELNRGHRNKAQGSDQIDPGSFLAWVRGIVAEDTDSITQLLSIDATAEGRFKE